MNILIIPSWYETDSNKIRGSFFKEQALALAKAGHTVTLGYVYMRTTRELFSKNLYRLIKKSEDGITEYVYHVPSFGSIKRGTWFSRNQKFYARLLKKLFRKNRFDVVHIHSFIPAGYAVSSLRHKLDLPIVYTEHFSEIVTNRLSDERKKALVATMENSDVLLAVSETLKKAMSQHSNKHIDVLPNILSPLFTYRPEATRPSSAIKFLSVGGLTELKRHDRSIKAFHDAFGADEAVTFSIIGEGKERKNLQNLIDELGENKRIKLLGRKTRQETAAMMQQSDAFILPSIAETFGVAYIEAIASGLPVIGTKNGGFEDIWFDGCGEIVPVDDHNELVMAYQKLYRNLSNYDRKTISGVCISKYGEKRIVELLETAYSHAIERYKKQSN